MRALSKLDERLSLRLFQSGRAIPRSVWKILEYSGDGIVWLVVATLIIIAGIYGNGFAAYGCSALKGFRPFEVLDDCLSLGINLLLGLLIDLLEVGLLKAICKRPRPLYNNISKDMNVIVPVDAYSFPSGHSSRVSFLAQLAILMLPIQEYKLAVASWALLVSCSRCMMGRHYCSDVVAGLILGTATTMILTRGLSAQGLELNKMACMRFASLLLKN
jgi:membrane-associated phospholipid phosphatase